MHMVIVVMISRFSVRHIAQGNNIIQYSKLYSHIFPWASTATPSNTHITGDGTIRRNFRTIIGPFFSNLIVSLCCCHYTVLKLY